MTKPPKVRKKQITILISKPAFDRVEEVRKFENRSSFITRCLESYLGVK